MMKRKDIPRFDRFDSVSVKEWSKKLESSPPIDIGNRSQAELELCYACTGVGVPKFHSANAESCNLPSFDNNAGSCLEPHKQRSFRKRQSQRTWIFGKVLDPRSDEIRRGNRWFLFVCGFGTAVDPLFLSVLSVNAHLSCLYVQERQRMCLVIFQIVYSIVVTVLRSLVDGMYLWQIWLQLKLAYVSKKSLVLGRGELVWDARKIARHYLLPWRGFAFDVFVILPVPQVMLWLIVPSMVAQGGVTVRIMNWMVLAFLCQYIPKLFHLVLAARRLQRPTGYIFGSASWGFVMNLAAYFCAAHVTGSIWYLLTVQRVESCIHLQCMNMDNCNNLYLGCPNPVAFNHQPRDDPARVAWAQSPAIQMNCLPATPTGNFSFGIYSLSVPLVTDTIPIKKILLPLFWGLMTMSLEYSPSLERRCSYSFGNALTPTDHILEVVFSILVITMGLLLFAMLIGNIQVFLHSINAKKEETQLRIRNQEWWMRRRQLPVQLRQRVRQYERQKWAATRGVDEEATVRDLPDSLRRDIKRHLCLGLVRQVPLFDQLDELVLDNICERLKPLLFIKGETVLNAGDPVRQMLFIVRGHIQSSYAMLHNNKTSICMLGPGNFCGDEILSWCLSKPWHDSLPLSKGTLVTLEVTEAFGLEAQDLMYITEHFPFKFANEKLKHTARYYSSSWRTWAASTVQLAWRRYKALHSSKSYGPLCFAEVSGCLGSQPLENSNLSCSLQDRLRLYTSMFISPKPQDYLE